MTQGEGMPRVEIEVRQDHQDDWRVYPAGGPNQKRALTERGVVLGGTFDMATADAERIARENGFFFKRPEKLWLPPSFSG